MDKMSWVLLVGLIAAVGFMMLRGGGDINGERAAELVKKGAKLVDVRTPGEFGDYHIPGAVNIPVQVIGQQLDKLGDKAGSIVLYCRSGARSSRAKALLMSAGFTDVHDLGSITNWQNE